MNTNTQFLAEKCALLGLTMYHQVTVGDNHDRLAEVIRTALKRSDVIILTGGLGPTEDDLTKEVCAEVMGFPLVEDTHTHERIEEYFRNNIYKVIPDNNWKQAIVPAGCIVLDNDNGTAPGLILEKYGKSAILLPGPPNELYPLFMNQVYPYLQKLQPEVDVYKRQPMERLLKEANELADQGVRELILVAQETTLYGVDLYGKKMLPELLHKLAEIPGIYWIRIQYCYPEELSLIHIFHECQLLPLILICYKISFFGGSKAALRA